MIDGGAVLGEPAEEIDPPADGCQLNGDFLGCVRRRCNDDDVGAAAVVSRSALRLRSSRRRIDDPVGAHGGRLRHGDQRSAR